MIPSTVKHDERTLLLDKAHNAVGTRLREKSNLRDRLSRSLMLPFINPADRAPRRLLFVPETIPPHASTEFPYASQRLTDAYNYLRIAAGEIVNIHLGRDFHLSYTNPRRRARPTAEIPHQPRSLFAAETADLIFSPSQIAL